MNTPTDVPSIPHGDRVFTRPPGLFRSPTGYYLLGALLLALGGAGFTFSAIRDVSVVLTTVLCLPLFPALWAFSMGFSTGRSPTKVIVGRDDLVLVYPGKERRLRWTDLAWAGTESSRTSFRHKEDLLLYKVAGKLDVRIEPGLSDFEDLVPIVRARVEGAQPEGRAPVRLQPHWKRACFILAVAMGVMVLAIKVLLIGHQELLDEARLTDEGIPGEGTVVRRNLAPNGTTPYLEYEVVSSNGETATRAVEVLDSLWESVDEGSTVSVRYVDDAPHISRLQVGEAMRSLPSHPIEVYGLPAAVMAIGIFLLWGGIMALYGIDVSWDAKTGGLGGFVFRRLGGP